MIKYRIYKKKEGKINNKIKSVRKAKERKWYEEKEELKKEYTKGNIKKIWDYLKRIRQKDEKRTYEHQPLEEKDNTKTVNTIENLERWREWMKENFCVENRNPKIETIGTKTIENDNILELLNETDYYQNEKHEREKRKEWNLGSPTSKKTKHKKKEKGHGANHPLKSKEKEDITIEEKNIIEEYPKERKSCRLIMAQRKMRDTNIMHELRKEFTINEVKVAIKDLALKKVVGKDNISAEIYRENINEISPYMQE